jgi:peptide/nickel transport system substrate-binding protein
LNGRKSGASVFPSILGVVVAMSVWGGITGCDSEPADETQATIGRGSPPELDPAIAHEPGDLEALWLVYTPLLTYRHMGGDEGTELIPGLAAELPEVSGDGRRYSLELRDGLEYSDGTEVKASDFEYAIDRTLELRPEIAPLYDAIATIEADDKSGEIEIELDQPAPWFPHVLALVSSAPLPEQAGGESASEPLAGVGPYEIAMAESDRFVLEHSEAFAGLGIPDIPIPEISRITVKAAGGAGARAQSVLDSKLDYSQDPPPAGLRPTILEQADDRFEEYPPSSTAYVWLDRSQPPFDDPLVREAINRALDKPRFAAISGDLVTPGCSFLAPALAGYDEGLDTGECPYGNPNQAAKLKSAKALIRQARAEGATVSVSDTSIEPFAKLSATYAALLERIGLDSEFPATSAAAADTGIATTLADLPSPVGPFTQVVGPAGATDAIPKPVYDPFLVAELERLSAAPRPEQTAGDWAALDRYLIAPPQSYVAPFGHRRSTTFVSERIDPATAILHPVYGNDYSSWTLKEGE